MKTMRRNTTRHTRGAGFTLIEIMLALGVLGVGMVMVATIFPAAIMQAKKSDENTRATLIADNARTILTMRITHDEANKALQQAHERVKPNSPVNVPDGEFAEVPMFNDGMTSGKVYKLFYDVDAWAMTIDREEFNDHYPGEWPPENTGTKHKAKYVDNETGWIALFRRVVNGTTTNDYQFAVIPYKEFPGVGYGWHSDWNDDKFRDPRPKLVNFNSNSKTVSSTGYGPVMIKQNGNYCEVWFWESLHSNHLNEIAKGSPVLLDGRNSNDARVMGRHPVITNLREDVDGATGTPSRVATLSGPLIDTTGMSPAQLDQLRDAGVQRGIWMVPGAAYGAPSPAMGCTVFRTQLQP